MKPVIVAAWSFAMACLLVIGNANAVDGGETRAMEYHQRQVGCAMVPRFAEQPMLIGAKTGDPEKDTIAFPVSNLQSSCASNQPRETGNAGPQRQNMTGSANAVDSGETRAMEYHQRQVGCAMVPRFAEQPMLIGAKTGDPEKDTIAFPVSNLQSSCASNQPRETGNAGLQRQNNVSKAQ